MSGYQATLSKCNIKKITFPSALTLIQMNAFRKMNSLESVSLNLVQTSPEEPLMIDAGAFAENPLLKTVSLPRYTYLSLFSERHYVAPFAHTPWAESIKDITITQQDYNGRKKFAMHIGKYHPYFYILLDSTASLFSLFTKVEHVTFRDISVIPKNVFSCSRHIPVRFVTIYEDSVTEIEENAFSDFYKLESISGMASVKKIGDNAFSRCYNLRSMERLDSIESIGKHAFAYCDSLKNLIFKNKDVQIHPKAFTNCNAHITIESLDSSYTAN